MRGLPPLEITVRRFGRWRGALLLLGAAGLAVTVSWWLALPLPRAGWTAAVATAAASLALLPLAEAVRLRPFALRWDGERWHVVGPSPSSGNASRSGRLQVALDLGDWLLLRFVADPPLPASSRGGTAAWIALQRGGLEAHWHALRCAIYSPPPAGPPGGAPTCSTE